MPRTVEITTPAAQTDQIVGKLRQLDGVVSLRVQHGISIQPPGDVITVATTNRALHPVMRALDQQGLVHNSAGSITTTQPTSLVSQPLADQIMNDVSEATWEEMEATIARESNMTVNGLVMMALAGVLAVVGLATNALHIVIAAMLIAPGFEPIVRIGLGIVARSRTLKLGISQTALAYLALVAGAAATTVVLRVIGKGPLGDESSYLPADVLIPYWTSLSAPSLLVSAAASLAGTLVIAIHRSVLTSGVMIALALVPTAAITGMGLATAQIELAGKGLLRWAMDLGLVVGASLLVLAWKRARVQKRKMLF